MEQFRIWRSYPTPVMIYETRHIKDLSTHDHPMEKTSSQDKNGRYAYEADVIQYRHFIGVIRRKSLTNSITYIAVDWLQKPVIPNSYSTTDEIKNSEIIGNLFENPDLITA
jgi:hypothetical protein